MKKIVTIKLELDTVEAEWLKRLMIKTFDYSESDENTNVRLKIVNLCDNAGPTSLYVIVFNEKEVEWLKALVQNPRCHPDQEDKTDKTLRYKFWTTLSNEIVRAAHVATPEDDDIPF